MTKDELIKKLQECFCDEYGFDLDEPIDTSEPIGVAYTEVYEDDEDGNATGEFYEMQINLDLCGDNMLMIYYLEGEEIFREEYESYEQIYESNFDCSEFFQGLYGFFIDKVEAVKGISVS